jgi:transcriptional antiterminator RfaH
VVRVVEPLFPCYIFARCSLERSFDEIRYVTGVSSLVHFGQRVAIVPEEVISDLRLQFQTEEPIVVEESLSPGTEVLVAEGAFLGSRAIVVQYLPAKQRVQILLEFLGRSTVAEVDRRFLTVEGRTVADLMPSLAVAARSSVAATAY